jgi:hypothetical protein
MGQDEDFINHETALLGLVRDHKNGDGPGPDADDLHWDMREGPESVWNDEVIQILLTRLRERKDGSRLPEQSDRYFQDILAEKYRQVRVIWNRAQPKKTDMGVYETPEDVERRLLARNEKDGKLARSKSRRHTVGTCTPC